MTLVTCRLARQGRTTGWKSQLFQPVGFTGDARSPGSKVAWAAMLKEWGGPRPGERPTGFVAILAAADRPQAPLTDIGIAAQTIQLAAAELGYGACMMGAIKRDEIHRVLEIPQEWAVHLVVALGRPAETVVLEELLPGSDPRYYRTPDGVHHVPKRRLEDVLVSKRGLGHRL